jgi:hypothetical protein
MISLRRRRQECRWQAGGGRFRPERVVAGSVLMATKIIVVRTSVVLEVAV